MNSKLHHIQNWEYLAQQAKWSSSALAKLCGISVRTLERQFKIQFKISPKSWLTRKRQQQAIRLIQGGCTAKEAAEHLAYKHATHFSQDFKKHWGCYPTQFDINNPDLIRCRVSV